MPRTPERPSARATEEARAALAMRPDSEQAAIAAAQFMLESKSKADAAGRAGIAILRRDGFASMDALDSGSLQTRTVQFSGKHFFVNAAAEEVATSVAATATGTASRSLFITSK